MSTSYIKSHNLTAHRNAGYAVGAAISKADDAVRTLQRRQDLYPAEQDRRIAEAKAAGAAEARQERDRLAALIAADRKEARYAEPAPSAEEATRRTFYATAAMAELAGLTPAEATATVKRVVDSGDHERAREYLRAATGKADPSALTAMSRLVEAPDARMHRSFAAAVDAMEAQLARLDQYIDQHLARVGVVSEDVKAGLADEQPMSVRQINLWADKLDERAGAAFTANEDHEAGARQRAERGDFINLRQAGTEGWDASDDLSAQQPTGDPQAPADAPADAQADLSDAGADQ